MKELTITEFERRVGVRKTKANPSPKLRKPDEVIRCANVYVWATKTGFVMQIHPPNDEIHYFDARSSAHGLKGSV